MARNDFSLVNGRRELRRPGSQGRRNREFTIIRKYFVLFGSLTISMLLNICRFWVWLLVSQLSRGCLAISVKHLKCNEHMLNMKIQKHFQRRKIILISKTKLMSER